MVEIFERLHLNNRIQAARGDEEFGQLMDAERKRIVGMMMKAFEAR